MRAGRRLQACTLLGFFCVVLRLIIITFFGHVRVDASKGFRTFFRCRLSRRAFGCLWCCPSRPRSLPFVDGIVYMHLSTTATNPIILTLTFLAFVIIYRFLSSFSPYLSSLLHIVWCADLHLFLPACSLRFIAWPKLHCCICNDVYLCFVVCDHRSSNDRAHPSRRHRHGHRLCWM